MTEKPPEWKAGWERGVRDAMKLIREREARHSEWYKQLYGELIDGCGAMLKRGQWPNPVPFDDPIPEEKDIGEAEEVMDKVRHDVKVGDHVARIRVVCAHEIRDLDCWASLDRVVWSCPCGFRYEKAVTELPSMPDVIMIDEDCRRKDHP